MEFTGETQFLLRGSNQDYRIFLPAEALFILRAVFSHLYGFGNQEVQILPT